MKNYEVGIVVAVIVLIGYFWWKNSEGMPIQEPIGKVTPVTWTVGGAKVPSCCIAPGGVAKQCTTMIPATGCILEQP